MNLWFVIGVGQEIVNKVDHWLGNNGPEIFIYHHMPTAHILLTLSLSLSIHPYQPLFLVSSLDSILCQHTDLMNVTFTDWPTLVCPCVRVPWRTSLMSLFLLLHHCPTCLVHVTWMVWEVESSIKQVLATTPHETPTVRTLAPITKTIQVRRTRHAGHCWRSKDELISDVLLWTPTHGCARVGRPARTYIQQLCEDTGCNPEDLPEAMNDREKWRETVRDIRAGGATWWWWWLQLYSSTDTAFSWEEFPFYL